MHIACMWCRHDSHPKNGLQGKQTICLHPDMSFMHFLLAHAAQLRQHGGTKLLQDLC